MITLKFQQKIDLLIDGLILRFLPAFLTPNMLTVIRLMLVPFVFLLVYYGFILAGFLIFIIAALTDALDGAMARTQNKITDWGKLMDPIADKLLIGAVFLYIGPEYLIVKIFLGVILLEIAAVVTSAFARKIIGRPIGANAFGKIKMVLQTLAIAIFLLGILTKQTVVILASEWILIIALIFALLSGLEQTRRKLAKTKLV